MTRKEYKKYEKIFVGAGTDPMVSEEEHIQALINRIIDTMYCPVIDEKQFIPANKPEGTHNEPINWGNLGCTEVRRTGKTFEAVLEECSPECQHLPAYIHNLLLFWGWECDIICEW